MTERERREGTGDTRDNVRDDLDEAARKRRKDGDPDVVEEESSGSGGAKENLRDDLEKTQRD